MSDYETVLDMVNDSNSNIKDIYYTNQNINKSVISLQNQIKQLKEGKSSQGLSQDERDSQIHELELALQQARLLAECVYHNEVPEEEEVSVAETESVAGESESKFGSYRQRKRRHY